eukprot:6186376-Pleurochrysis_carterae.AAC.2
MRRRFGGGEGFAFLFFPPALRAFPPGSGGMGGICNCCKAFCQGRAEERGAAAQGCTALEPA